MIAYRYLYWACAFGHIFIVNAVLKNHGVSPFMADKEECKTPFMQAIEHNCDKVVKLLLAKDFIYPSNPKLIDRQKQAPDKYSNNPMHKACRFRNPKMIEMLLQAEIGRLDQRNIIGRMPLEMPHNDILNDRQIKSLFSNFVQQHGERYKNIVVLNKEPDYMFVVNKDRAEVLTDQLEEINKAQVKRHGKNNDEFGLLHSKRKFIDWKEYRMSTDPDKTSLILVHFSDRILNLKAEDIHMMVQLQNKFHAVPFVLEAQNNFQAFSASQRMTLYKLIFEQEFDI